MAGRKGMKHYPESFKLQIKKEHDAGASMKSLHRKYGVSVYSIESPSFVFAAFSSLFGRGFGLMVEKCRSGSVDLLVFLALFFSVLRRCFIHLPQKNAVKLLYG